jgi:hypothetical protein
MIAFLVGLAVAIVLAIGTVLGLNVVDRSTPQAFYTRDTVPLDYTVPTDGRLDGHR